MGIVDFLKLWVRDIALIFIVVSIIEIILPNNNMKRYIDMIIGFLIIIVIITPFIKLLHKDFNIDRKIFRESINQTEFLYFLYKDDVNLSSIQEEQIKEIYFNKIEEEIKDLVYENNKYIIDEMNISIYEDEYEYGRIKSIELIIKENRDVNQSEELITVDNIEKVSIGEGEKLKTTIIEFEDGQNIKNIISKKYNVPKENIKIFLNTIGKGELSGKVHR